MLMKHLAILNYQIAILFGIFNLKLAMPRLSGPDICNITKDFGLLLNGLAVWIYDLNGVIFTEKEKHSEL